MSDNSCVSVPKLTHEFGELRTPSPVLRADHVRLLMYSTALTQDRFSDFFDFPHVIMILPMLSSDSSIIWSIDNGRADGRDYRRYNHILPYKHK